MHIIYGKREWPGTQNAHDENRLLTVKKRRDLCRRDLVEDTLRNMAASLSRLEELFATLDNKVQGLNFRVQNSHTEIDHKLNSIVSEQKGISERLDRQKREFDSRLEDCHDRLEGHGNSIYSLEQRLGSFDHGELREVIFDLVEKYHSCNTRMNEIMERGSSTVVENLKQVIVDMTKKMQYLETKLLAHDRKFLEVSCDLKERYMTISGIKGRVGHYSEDAEGSYPPTKNR